MSTPLYPMILEPVLKDYLWGGQAIATRYGRGGAGRCGESWEVADRPEGMTHVANGPFEGLTLHEVLVRLGSDLTGTAADLAPSGGRFPLLVKIIDAARRLSVQVHPDNASAALHGGEPKTEAWYVLDARPGARVFAGLRPGTDATALLAALRSGRAEDVLRSYPVTPGDAIFIPGGRVHAIGEGCLLLEVQQNSNTTWRVHDWDRMDPRTGTPRELHVQAALKVIHWSDEADETLLRPQPLPRPGPNRAERVVSSPYFHMTRVELRTGEEVARDPATFGCYFVAEGSVRVTANGIAAETAAGTSFLVPAAVPGHRLEPLRDSAVVLHIALG